MKHWIKVGLFLITGFVHTVLWAAGTKSGYQIQAHFKGLQAQDTVYFCRYYGDKRFYQDTAIVDAKSMVLFQDTTTLAEGMYFFLFPKQRIMDVILSPTHFSLSADPDNIISTVQFKGSPDNTDFYAYQKYFQKQRTVADSIGTLYKQAAPSNKAQYEKQLKQIDSSMVQYITNFIQTHPKNLFTAILKTTKDVDIPEAPLLPSGARDTLFMYRYYKAHYFDQVDFTDNRLIRTPVLASKVEDYFKRLVVNVSDSITKEIDFVLSKCAGAKDNFEYFTREFTYKYETSTVMGMDAVFVHMAKNYYMKGKCPWATQEVVKKISDRANLLEPLLIGKVAPNLYMADTSGKYVYLSAIQAKYIILYFWDSGCGHCQKETPKLYEWWLANRAKGIAVYAANIERKDEEWLAYIRKNNIKAWYNVRDKYNHTDFKQTYDIYSTPVMYVLNEKKEIIAKRIGMEDLDDFLKAYEKMKKNK